MRDLSNPFRPGSDEGYMYDALQLAQGGLGWASPNPLVGCVLVRDGRVIGRGCHQADGYEHAEVNALREAGDARGATAYVSLEPCTHVGRQPSCCNELHAAGVKRVVYGATDTDSRTAGKCDRVLQELGVEVTGGVLGKQCSRVLDYYLHSRKTGTLFAHLKLALSLDAKMACANGSSQWLSGPQSLGYAHYLRQKYDAIMVGYRTVIADNPRLTTRLETLSGYRDLPPQAKPRNPVRVVLDPGGRLFSQIETLNIADTVNGEFRDNLPRLVIVTGSSGKTSRLPSIRGLEHIQLDRTVDGDISFMELYEKLWPLGIQSLLIEGGAGLARSIFAQQAVHKMSLVYAPVFIGDDGMGFAPIMSNASIDSCPSLKNVIADVLGVDCLIAGYL